MKLFNHKQIINMQIIIRIYIEIKYLGQKFATYQAKSIRYDAARLDDTFSTMDWMEDERSFDFDPQSVISAPFHSVPCHSVR